jgi:hypothetical protein
MTPNHERTSRLALQRQQEDPLLLALIVRRSWRKESDTSTFDEKKWLASVDFIVFSTVQRVSRELKTRSVYKRGFGGPGLGIYVGCCPLMLSEHITVCQCTATHFPD